MRRAWAAVILLLASLCDAEPPGVSGFAQGEFLSSIPYASYIDFDAEGPGGDVFDVRDFGAIGDGKTNNAAAIAKAVDAAHANGGGVVRIEAGDYVSGTIALKSNVTLYVAKDTILRASREPAHYGPAHFIDCEGASNVGIVGPGKILGEGDAWWSPPRAVAPVAPPDVYDLQEMKSLHFAAKRKKAPNRPSPFIRIRESADIRIANLIVENSPGWTIMLDHCDRAHLSSVVLNNNYHGENTDGIDVVGSCDVTIDRCFVSTGDDGIVLKNGFANELSRTMKNVQISRCAVRSGANCIKIGTETWSDISGVRISDCRLFTDEIWPWALSAIAIESVDGARVREISVENITVRNVNAPVFIRLGNRNRWKDKDRAGALESIIIRNLDASGVEFPCVVSGFPGKYVKDVTFQNIAIVYRHAGERLAINNAVPEVETQYPEFWMFGDLPACGLYARHVNGLTVRSFRVVPRSGNQRQPTVFDDVLNSRVED